jgi:hypothetical protein
MECQVCYEHFDSNSFIPKILVKCGHSFCKICLERLMSNKTYVSCPVCRENTKIQKKEPLPTNYSLIQIIEKHPETIQSKNLLEKYKYFDDKNYKHVNPILLRQYEPKKLNLKKIVNDDFIYVEEFENNQNYSLFSNLPKRNRRYNFNKNSYLSYFYNEYSYSLGVFRKASKCKHSFSCLEHILNNCFFYGCIAVASKLPLNHLLKYFYKEEDKINNYTRIIQFAIVSIFSGLKFIKCSAGFYIDDLLSMKK